MAGGGFACDSCTRSVRMGNHALATTAKSMAFYTNFFQDNLPTSANPYTVLCSYTPLVIWMRIFDEIDIAKCRWMSNWILRHIYNSRLPVFLSRFVRLWLSKFAKSAIMSKKKSFAKIRFWYKKNADIGADIENSAKQFTRKKLSAKKLWWEIKFSPFLLCAEVFSLYLFWVIIFTNCCVIKTPSCDAAIEISTIMWQHRVIMVTYAKKHYKKCAAIRENRTYHIVVFKFNTCLYLDFYMLYFNKGKVKRLPGLVRGSWGSHSRVWPL